MLVELVVENYAVVERVRVRFHPGLNLLTGETGSGKSIVVDALGLLYGGRASADVVRSGAARARVTGIFQAPATDEFKRLLDESGIDVEDGELLVEREVQVSGKSRAFVGSRPVAITLLRSLAAHLGDLHGQHDQQELFSADGQLEMVDSFAGSWPVLRDVAEIHARWQRACRELEELDRGEQERLRMTDLWSFQQRELNQAGLRQGEDTALDSERRVLANVARLQEHAGAAFELLYQAEGAALAQVRQARKRLEELCRIDPSQAGTLAALQPAEIALAEAAHALRQYLGGLEADPARLEQVESRLAAIDKLKRKYGSSVEEMIAFLEDVSARLEAMETAGERRAKIESERDQLAARYKNAARALSKSRKKAAAELERKVQEELALLAMEGTVFRVEFSECEWTARGADRVRFLLSANRGEEPRPLDRVASGGELSRLALALKTCVVAQGAGQPASLATRTLVFDEVDAGIGGRTAEALGRRLKRLSTHYQVLCVTHAPQVAGFADHHYVVEKRDVEGRTCAVVEELTGDARTREIGRMLSGVKMTPEALKHAEQLIKAGAQAQ
jgi:DNA repair protein RecN (Recombination protein N)